MAEEGDQNKMKEEVKEEGGDVSYFFLFFITNLSVIDCNLLCAHIKAYFWTEFSIKLKTLRFSLFYNQIHYNLPN